MTTSDYDDPVSTEAIDAIVAGVHHDPHAVLGAHPGPAGVRVRALRPLAQTVSIVLGDGRRVPMQHLHEGVFSALLPADANGTQVPGYQLAVSYASGPELVTDDPYRHLPTLGDIDLHLIAEGRHEELWRVLGAHVRGAGTSFAVWAPSARGVRVIGDFNHWDGRAHPMRSLGSSGIWELYVPGVAAGTTYKYEVCGPDGTWVAHADPMAAFAERPPATGSVVYDSGYQWDDADWVARRAGRDVLTSPMSVYEVHLGSWRPALTYIELADQLTAYVTDLGFTHVEFLPVAEHPFGGSWGYQVTSYYAPTSRFGSPDEFRYLVDRLHQAGVGVLLDWVPAHFPRDAWALARFDGTPLYEHPDPRRGEHPDWGTLIFDYGRPEVRNFLVANALYWLQEFHADGLRVDAVASMLYLDYSRKAGEWAPNELGGRENLDAVAFLREVNATCYRVVPGITMIAEESTAWPGVTRPVHLGGLGFGLKWNMGWMHDTLAYLSRDPIHRSYHHDQITFSMIYAYSENYVLPLSHDEVVHGKASLLRKMAGDEWKQFAGLRSLLAYMWAHPGKQLLFMGSEFGQGDEWSADAGLPWHLLDYDSHRGVQKLVTDLNRAYAARPALWRQDSIPAGFSWIDANDTAGNVLSFVRLAGELAGPPPGAAGAGDPAAAAGRAGAGADDDDRAAGSDSAGGSDGVVACIVNFSGEPHHNYRIGLPRPGSWQELINTDAADYGGSGVGNLGVVTATDEPYHGMPASAVISIPPLGALWLTPVPPEPPAAAPPASSAVRRQAQL